MKRVILPIIFFLLANTAYADFLNVPKKIYGDFIATGSVSTSTVTATDIWLGQKVLPESAGIPSNNEVIKYDSGLNQWNFEADADSGGAPEGTAVLSSGEGGASKYLREDGDGTCSWQTPAGGGGGLGTNAQYWTFNGNTIYPVTANTVTAVTVTGTNIMANASLRIPYGTDPDVDAVGEITFDSDDYALRGFDGSNQIVIGQKDKIICFFVGEPDGLAEADFAPIWHNRTGFTYIVTALYSTSDTDDADYTLKVTDNDYTDHTNLQTIKAITISTNGTGTFYDASTTGFTEIYISNNTVMGYDASADDVDYISGAIVGYLDGDVN